MTEKIDGIEFDKKSIDNAREFEIQVIEKYEGLPKEATSGDRVTKIHIDPKKFMENQAKNKTPDNFAEEALASVVQQTLARSKKEEEEAAKRLGIPIKQPSSEDNNRQPLYNSAYTRKKPVTESGVGPTPTTSTIVPRPPITPQQVSASNANGFLYDMSKKKDECVIPIKQVSLFISNVMGEDFGYITKKMAKNMVAMIPKEAAILAIQTSKDDAKKFLDSDDKEIRREAIKKFFDVDDEEIEKFESILSTPGFEVNPWT